MGECRTVQEKFRENLLLNGFTEELWTESHEKTLDTFIDDTSITVLVVYVGFNGEFKVEFYKPSVETDFVVTFFREPGAVITLLTYHDVVQSTAMSGNAQERLFSSLYGLSFEAYHKKWEKTYKDNYTKELQNDLLKINDDICRIKGTTELYIPYEGLKVVPEKACTDLNLVQRMETVVIHWRGQIKKMLMEKENTRLSNLSGLLQEIEVWRHYLDKLRGISLQLQQQGVRNILNILQLSKSHVEHFFSDVANEIQSCLEQAESNLKWLSVLKEACEELVTLSVNQVVPKLQRIMQRIYVIWNRSPYYNTKKLITGLFQKMSNDVIQICMKSISLDHIFTGYVVSSKEVLTNCIECCLAWRNLYQRISRIHQENFPKPPSDPPDTANIFVILDTFVIRFQELVEVCDCQRQFARWEDGEQGPLPIVGWSEHQEFNRRYLDLEKQFQQCLEKLRSVSISILDVEDTTWMNEFIRFGASIMKLEVQAQNLIISVVKPVQHVDEGVRLLRTFRPMLERELMKRTLEEMTEQVYSLLDKDLKLVNRQIERGPGDPPFYMPTPEVIFKFDWLRCLKRRLQKPMEVLLKSSFLPELESCKQMFASHSQKVQLLEKMMRQTFNDWTQGLVGKDFTTLLQQTLMVRCKDQYPLLDLNFDMALCSMLREVPEWEERNFEIPQSVLDISRDAEDYLDLKEEVMLLIRKYNSTIEILTEELELFHDQISFLDMKLQPGLSTYTWLSKDASEQFVNGCQAHVDKMHINVEAFNWSNQSILDICSKISETLLVQLDGKTVYRNLDFENDQRSYRASQLQIMQSEHQKIVDIMKEIYKIFIHDGPAIQEHWRAYAEKIDGFIEEALRSNIKTSIQKLEKAINGGLNNTYNPLFKMLVTLNETSSQSPSQVDFSPTLEKLSQLVNILPHLTDTIVGFKRLPEVLDLKGSQQSPIHRKIEQDEEIKKIQAAIIREMNAHACHLQIYLQTWDKYKDIWKINKDLHIKNYNRDSLPSTFDKDINEYEKKAKMIKKEETVVTVRVITLDCSYIKATLLNHCYEWQSKHSRLLYMVASSRLKELVTSLKDNAKRLMHVPQSMEELGESLKLLDTLKNKMPKTEAQIPLIQEQFVLLDKHEEPMEPEVLDLHKSLMKQWQWFQQVLVETEDGLQKKKDEFKIHLLASSEELKKKIESAVYSLSLTSPIDSKLSSETAFKQLEQQRGQMAGLKKEESSIINGLSFFDIEQPPFENIITFEKDLEHLQQVWEITEDWNTKWNMWKAVHVSCLQTESMEITAQDMCKRLHALHSELKDKKWNIVNVSKSRIEHVKTILPLISDLRNPAMRDRHWKHIQDVLQHVFDPTSSEFTLEKIMSMGFERFKDDVSEISGAATKELSFEESLDTISKTWDETFLDITLYKDGYYQLTGTEEIFHVLEDNLIKLSTMKASCSVKAFKKEVDSLERSLKHMMENIEMILTVQCQWIYLENIFQGNDICKQLPSESTEFQGLSGTWKSIMNCLQKNRNALQGTHDPDLLETLRDMCGRLEGIQKALYIYLETKRQLFPRLYFLSNNDLLEILRHSQNPEAMQPHLKKCFGNIKTLKMRKLNAYGIFSADGEYIPLTTPVSLEKPVELWLCELENSMRHTMKESLTKCHKALQEKLSQRDKWVKEWPGQMLITSSQIQWTNDVTKALKMGKEQANNSALKSLEINQVSMLESNLALIQKSLSKVQRLKIEALITIEVHARDVIYKLVEMGCNDYMSFEWLSQLRFSWSKKAGVCIIRQNYTCFKYGYEYLGNPGRLVVTPLTDRCYFTLNTALHNHHGGSLVGPTGTGKTETIKNLGKTMGQYVIVVNCSEGLDFKSMGRMYSGLAQTGAWGCFDEFNHVNIEVLSVVAQQIRSILSALAAGHTNFLFERHNIQLVSTCGIFITMNPGSAGHTELPDDLKSMFRPISMVMPDSTMIAEIILFAQGFNNCKLLAKKACTLCSLAMQQLSKQDHYDFGLRTLTSILCYAGRKRHTCPSVPDEKVLLMAIEDMTVAKLTATDLPLFSGILQDLFPDLEIPVTDYSQLQDAIEVELHKCGLQVTPFAKTKIIQLFETKSSRHSSMLVGKTGSGKSVTWRVLQKALTTLSHNEIQGFQPVQVYPLNPKCVSLEELYGEHNFSTDEWSDGVLSSLMRTACADESPDEKWIVFDGPVDTLWIERLNSVMDDNKVLTLNNGERIALPEQVSLLFEVENLAQASPSAVSRCGMVYNDCTELGWKPYLHSWLDERNKSEVELLNPLFEKYVEPTLLFKKNNCKEPIPTSELNGVISLCRLYDSLATSENGVNVAEAENLEHMVQLWFFFSLVWSIGASVDQDGRKKMDYFLKELTPTLRLKDTIYDYYVDTDKGAWAPFEKKLTNDWRFNSNAPFYKIMVPTVDTVRYDFLVRALVMGQYPVLLSGPVGTGKTFLAKNILQTLNSFKWATLTINLSSQTSSNNIQSIMESCLEKNARSIFMPVGAKRLLCFLDDLNMPALDLFGSQPPLELLRHWIDYGFWYDRQKQTVKVVKDMSLLATMGPPGGGRTHISSRLQSRFNLINMTFPSEPQIMRIYSTMINQKLLNWNLKPIGNVLTQATIELYYMVSSGFLPTPAKIHYLFNLRDISRVFQGLLRAHQDFHDSKQSMVRLWIHECFRVFSDRLVDRNDQDTFICFLSEKLASLFDVTYHNICPNKQAPVFGEFLSKSQVYEDLLDMKALKAFMETQLEDYNLTPGVVPVSLVLFKDAIQHITRIVRVISQLRGNMLLLGISGSGRTSLAKIASFICDYQVFQVEVTKQYGKLEFRKDIKGLYRLTGVDNKPTVFLFNDTVDIVDESFLEDINNFLSSGEVPNLFKQDELAELCDDLSVSARKENVMETPDSLFSFLIERVRNNLHIVLCMSPVREAFRNRIHQYPALVNCTTIDWFCDWPNDALLEVAESYLTGMDLGSQKGIESKVARMFVNTHQSVERITKQMKLGFKRHNYVTPTNYLELVSGYKKLLAEKRKEIGDQVNKLRNGLFRISDTSEKVKVISSELEEVNTQLANIEGERTQHLLMIYQYKAEAKIRQQGIDSKIEEIAAEQVHYQAMADNAQRNLDEALPALEEARKALESLSTKDMTEILSYGHPPAPVEMVMNAVMTLLEKECSWAMAKQQLGEANFLNSLANFDRDNISDKVLKEIEQYCKQPDFQPETIGKVSQAAQSLCMWVRAMEIYGNVHQNQEPKRAKLTVAMSQLKDKQAALDEALNKRNEVADKLNELKKKYEEREIMIKTLKNKSGEKLEKLHRADQLVSALARERVCWEDKAKGLEECMGFLVGDSLLAASLLSYMGPFSSKYRDKLLDVLLKEIRDLEISCSPGFSFSVFLSKPTVVQEWNLQGLPSDAFSTENGVIVTRGNRWPLIVDPHGQALKWIKNMEMKNGLKIVDFQMPDYLLELESAIQSGRPVILQNVQEDLDPSLNPLLNKSLTRTGGRLSIKLGGKRLEYNPDFRFYIITKLCNPQYGPEISIKTTIVNFAVKDQGLEAQLLGIIVQRERPELEKQKDSLVISIADGKLNLQKLEDEILRLLYASPGSLLDDELLVNTLQTSKVTSSELSKLLASSETTQIAIDAAREVYRPCAQRAAILFSILIDLGCIDPMYQFSLDAYISLFTISIKKSKHSKNLKERIANLNDYHTYAVYRNTCRSLFKKHQLLFSFQMCAKILEVAGLLNMEEYNFFLRAGVVLDKKNQQYNPCASWLQDTAWNNITMLGRLPNFKPIIVSFEVKSKAWREWFTSAEPENAPLPDDWGQRCDDLQKMLIVRSLRPDRVSYCVASFVCKWLGSRFVEPPALDLKAVVDESTCRTPLIFVLSPGVDPTGDLLQLVESSGKRNQFYTLSLGQGQAPIAKQMLTDGINCGHWVFLANCHLSPSWMPELDNLVDKMQVEQPHPDFRLWVSSSTCPEFPTSILQAGIKMTTEPPKGLKANMMHLYDLVTESQFSCCSKPDYYCKLLFSLCFFHGILLERKRFQQLGWNISYSFNDSDFEVSENFLSLYLDKRKEVSWDALKHLIAVINYGGHVTDKWDERLLTTYINDYFCEAAVTQPTFQLSTLPTYYIPRDCSQASCMNFISDLPTIDPPEVFGQHPNADIACQIAEARSLFDSLLSMQPQGSSAEASGTNREERVLEMLDDVGTQVPALINCDLIRAELMDDPSPLDNVLLQEIQRYNALLETIKLSCYFGFSLSIVMLQNGIKGLVVMSPGMEEILSCIYDARVPPLWGKVYPSLKPLASWTRDLGQRVAQFASWAETRAPPTVFWLSGFTFPNSFLTAVLQSAARERDISVDSLSWTFKVFAENDSHQLPPQKGVYIHGMFLEGAGWDRTNACLVEPEPLQMVCPIPTIHFKPVKTLKKMDKGKYLCPCYYLPVRSGQDGRASFVVGVELKSGAAPPEHWVKRGTALLLSLDH